jgi:hypothetical protein
MNYSPNVPIFLGSYHGLGYLIRSLFRTGLIRTHKQRMVSEK